jgi:hypothetical protein
MLAIASHRQFTNLHKLVSVFMFASGAGRSGPRHSHLHPHQHLRRRNGSVYFLPRDHAPLSWQHGVHDDRICVSGKHKSISKQKKELMNANHFKMTFYAGLRSLVGRYEIASEKRERREMQESIRKAMAAPGVGAAPATNGISGKHPALTVGYGQLLIIYIVFYLYHIICSDNKANSTSTPSTTSASPPCSS